MELGAGDRVLVTGATGLVGSHVAERAVREGLETRVIVRQPAAAGWLDDLGAEVVSGDMADGESLRRAVAGVSVIVHCAAKVGDWGPVEDYREVNVRGVERLLDEAEAGGSLKRFIHISSLGVYEARDHHGTDETEEPDREGIDGYTLTKVESEDLVLARSSGGCPVVVLRPGFVYGSRDRTVVPRLLERLQAGAVKFLGSGEQLMNNTYVGNLVDAVFLAISRDDVLGEVFNITDERLVTKREFIGTIAREAGLDEPTGSVPLWLARALARGMERTWRLLGKTEAPLLSSAKIKFLGLNLDFDIGKARRELSYAPRVEFSEGMAETINWCRKEGLL
ncbi:MAG: oxidoreductase [Planctomycetaceae bacterium]|jgi:nucleoside-diphosphate-sugar epimerase|nr:oxidoreductase [Planctomycetaceae bacterium]MDP7277704.1 NAD-dependent epimerase/dehydratase family protein [Planctomycetaceae bacterium]